MHRTHHPPDEDFVGSRTLWDRGLCGIQDFVGFRTSWDLGLNRKKDPLTHRIGILFCGVLLENTNFQDKFYNMDTTSTAAPMHLRSYTSQAR